MVALRSVIFLVLFSVLAVAPAHAFQQMEFVRELGEAGKKAKLQLFKNPRALAVNGDRLYVADTNNHRVVVLDLNGKKHLTWGTKGGKPGEFKYPAGIALDEQGRVYIADTGNSRVQVFDSEGKWLRGFGAKGDGPHEFNEPMGIAVSHGIVYLADTGNSRVQVLTADGIAIRQVTVKTESDEMKDPVDVAVDAQNRIYAVEAKGSVVRIFNSSGNQVRTFGSRGSGVEGFDRPQGIAVDSRGNIYVADMENHKLKKFNSTGKLVGSIGSEGPGVGQFLEAVGLDVDRDGAVWVIDSGKNTIQVFSTEKDDAPLLAPESPLPTVEFLREISGEVTALTINKRPWGLTGDSLSPLGISGGRTIGSRGSEPGLLKKPRGLATDSRGNFWVADTANGRLQKFNNEGDLLQVIGKSGSGEGEFDSPSGVAVTLKGNICVADTGNNRVQVFSPKGVFLWAVGKSGKLAGQFNEVVDIAVDALENIYVVDRGNNRIAKYDSSGGLLWETGKAGKQDGEFQGPENIVISPDDEVYVLDAGNGRIQVFSGSGKFLRKFGSEGLEAGQFKEPQGLVLEEGLRLYVGDRGNKRVQAFLLKHTTMSPKEVSAQAKMNEIQLSWKANTETYLERYKIYRANAATEAFTLLGTTSDPFYLDKSLPSNRTFFYRVTSQAKEGNESASASVVTAATPKLVPSVPKRVKAEALEKQITLSWLPNLEPYMKQYRVYRKQVSTGFELLATTDKTTFIDRGLADETFYYYQVTAQGKEGDESPPCEEVVASTPKASLTAPPIEITKIEAGEIFATSYKYYESHALGKVVITNNTDLPYQKIKLSFSIKDFMDYPTEVEIPELAPKQTAEFPLKPVFNNKILEVTENTPLQSELALTYYAAGEPKTIKRSFPLTLYEKHAMRWDNKAKLGAFVTHKDPVVTDFSRQVVSQYVDAYPNLPQSLVYARGIYDALGVLGLKYIVDPSSPFQEFSESALGVDYIQYPRETLARKSGDCDDLSTLFAASMENIGVGVAFLDVPGHVFVMFNTGVLEKDIITLGFPEDQFALYQGTVWVPVEMTMVGASFTRAWQKGAEEYRDWSAKKSVDIISVQKSWDQFTPVTLPKAEGGVKIKRAEIEKAYKDELEALGRQRLTNLSVDYRDLLKRDPKDVSALGQLGLLYGENGLYSEALEQFQKILAVDKANALALNNIGNISYLQGRLDDARQAYEAALKASPDDPGIMVNLARIALQGGKKEAAKKLFQDAASIDPRVLRQYSDLAAGLGVVK